jgi:hypothetical protein
MNLKCLLNFSMGLAILLSTPFISVAGTRHCYSYPGSSNWCVDEKGFRIDCIDYGSVSVCTGKNNYRKECKGYADRTGVCNDSNGVRTVCQSSNSGGTCENSKGYKSVCTHIDANRTVCTDISRWGKPIKN